MNPYLPPFREIAANSPATNIPVADTGGSHSTEPVCHLPTLAIVDDDESDREVMSRTLGKSGKFHITGLYGSADEALREIPRVRPEVVLMDIRMPGISGIECALRLRAVLPGLVVIFVTGVSDAAATREASKVGGDGFLVKPLEIAQCLATVRFAIERKLSGHARAHPAPVLSGLAGGRRIMEPWGFLF
jgi:DNA-binding NarL/FixJ family response regulator